MIGVFAFYATLFESAFEKKISVQIHNIVPRVYNELSFFNLKRATFITNVKKVNSVPNLKTRKFILKTTLQTV
jgi:hypothetical protein